jgi:hypothetical protein
MESMDIGIEYNPTRQESLLNSDDYAEMAALSQELVGIRSSCSTVRIVHPEIVVDPTGQSRSFTEFDSFCQFTKGAEGWDAVVALPRHFSSAQSELEISAHELTHTVTKLLLDKYTDLHVSYVVQEYVSDTVATHIRQRVMEDNIEPGVVSGELVSESAFAMISRDRIDQFLDENVSDEAFFDPDNVGHLLARKMVATLGPLTSVYGEKSVVRGLMVNPPQRGELYDFASYRERLNTVLENSNFDFAVDVAPVKIVVE